MSNQTKLIVSHAPFWHNGSNVTERSYAAILAAVPAVAFGILRYGVPAIAVVCFSMSTAMIWEFLLNRAMQRPATIGDGNAALVGLLLAMLLPATTPWWVVLTGTFLAIVIGKQIFGGIGANPFNPVVVALAIMSVSWKELLDFEVMLTNYDFGHSMLYPLTTLKAFGPSAIEHFGYLDLLLGQQAGGLGATFGIGIVAGGIYLIARGFIHWEISLSYIAGILITAMLFYLANPVAYAHPLFHLLTGYTLIGAFFLATEYASSPVNRIPMLLYGASGGFLTVLIRNIGSFDDGVILAILIINSINPLLDKIRPKAIGKVA
jgi:Na+-translocating ferredoxin:NAD+ oxidoreductase subunit D